MEETLKQTLLDRFRAYLDQTDAETAPDEIVADTDLYTVFVELAGLRSEVRTESRLVKEALDQFRSVFDALSASHEAARQELDRLRTDAGEQTRAALRPMLLDCIDLRDRLLAALQVAGKTRRDWFGWRVRRDRDASGGEAWQEGLRMTLRRLDQMLLDRRVTPMALRGMPFDPRRARVVGTVPDDQVREGVVAEEVRAGFLWEDQVLRVAEVIVAKRRTATGEQS